MFSSYGPRVVKMSFNTCKLQTKHDYPHKCLQAPPITLGWNLIKKGGRISFWKSSNDSKLMSNSIKQKWNTYAVLRSKGTDFYPFPITILVLFKIVHTVRCPIVSRVKMSKCHIFLALVCATAQQSHCNDAGVRHPSSVKRIKAKFCVVVLVHYISRPFLFVFQNFIYFFIYFFFAILLFSLTCGYMRGKISNVSSGSTHQINSQNLSTPSESLYHSCYENCGILNFGQFWLLFFGL